MNDRGSPLLGGLVVVTAASFFGMLGVLSRSAYGIGLTPLAFVGWRAGIGALVIGTTVAFAASRGGRLVGWRSLDRRAKASLAIASVAGAISNMGMYLAFARTSVAIVLLCFYLYPAIVTGISGFLGWERMDRPRAVALVIALSGMVAVVVGGPTAGTGGIDPLGVGLALAAASGQAVFVLVSRQGYRAVPIGQAMTVILGVSALIAALLAVIGSGFDSLTLPFGKADLFGLLIFAGVFAAAVPNYLFLAGIRWIGPVRAGILMLVEPLVGVSLAAIFLHEAIGPIQAAGGVAILAAVLLIQQAQRAEPALVPVAEP